MNICEDGILVVSDVKTWKVSPEDHEALVAALVDDVTVNRTTHVHSLMQRWITEESAVGRLAFIKEIGCSTERRLNKAPHLLTDYRNLWAYNSITRIASCIIRKVPLSEVHAPYKYHSFGVDMSNVVVTVS